MATNAELEQQISSINDKLLEVTTTLNNFINSTKNVDQLDPSVETDGTEKILIFQANKSVKTILNDLLPVRILKINGTRFLLYKTGGSGTGLEINDRIEGVYNGNKISAIYLGGAIGNLSDSSVWDMSTL